MGEEWRRVDQADTSRRDGMLRPHDPNRTFAENLVACLRQEEAYTLGRTFPTGMMLIGTARHPAGFRLVEAAIMPLFRFENSTPEQLFTCISPEADRIYCVPLTKMAKNDAEAKRVIAEMIQHNDMGRALNYLHVNGWWVARPTRTEDGHQLSQAQRGRATAAPLKLPDST